MNILHLVRRFACLVQKNLIFKNILFKILCLACIIMIINIYCLITDILSTEDFQNFDYPMKGEIYEKIELHGTGQIPSLNPDNFKVKLTEVVKKKNLLFLYLIKTRYESVEIRNFIRNTWVNQRCANKLNVTWSHVFLFGELIGTDEASNNLREHVHKESHQYKDIVILDYIDNYYNNTYKVFGGLDFGIREFPDAKYLVVVDDDYFVHPINHAEYIQSIHPARYDIYVGGSIWYKPRPKRSSSKWSISYEIYPYNVFPDYPAGGHIIFSMPMARKISIAFRYTLYMAFDDVLIGIILFKLGITSKNVPGMCKNTWDLNNLKDTRLISMHSDKNLDLMKKEWDKYDLNKFCELQNHW